jgi:hypothetical protein
MLVIFFVNWVYVFYSHLVCFMVIWYIFGNLVYFLVIWQIFWLFGIFSGYLAYFSVLVCYSMKNLATLVHTEDRPSFVSMWIGQI